MRLTSDHSYVQHLIDTKRISQSETHATTRSAMW